MISDQMITRFSLWLVNVFIVRHETKQKMLKNSTSPFKVIGGGLFWLRFWLDFNVAHLDILVSL